MRWSRVLPLVVTVALLPLLSPAAWLHSGAFPDLGLLVTVFVALRAHPDRATLTGVLIGLAGTPWTAEPLGLHAFLLGAVAFATTQLRRTVDCDRALVQLAIVFAAAVLMRLVPAAIESTPGATWHAVPPALLAALATSIAAPVVLPALRALRFIRRPTPRFVSV